ncbi:MAG TPA: C-terminal helicase domain-containing protein, partial [Ruminiclostridium sp.]|nr:C-terminal helicase domain-containing protein [Ruminiclostridium sp.]
GIKADAIHGNKSQSARQLTLRNFKAKKIKVLVATDIAARGIDVVELSHVINYDLPNVPETYIHRIGRTGRAGQSGTAISFCDREEIGCLRDIQKLTGKKIPVVTDHPYAADISAAPVKKPDFNRFHAYVPKGQRQYNRGGKGQGRVGYGKKPYSGKRK